jgi:hypothetical protein
MMSFFKVPLKDNDIFMNVEKNTAKTPTVVTDEEYHHLKDLIARVPQKYLDIFSNPPYAQCDWAQLLIKE